MNADMTGAYMNFEMVKIMSDFDFTGKKSMIEPTQNKFC